MTTYDVVLHWRDGSTQSLVGEGRTRTEATANALNRAGIGNGALPALDYWEAVPR